MNPPKNLPRHHSRKPEHRISAEHRSQVLKTAKKKKRRDSFGPLKRMRKTLAKTEDEKQESEYAPQYPIRAPEPVTARAEPGESHFVKLV